MRQIVIDDLSRVERANIESFLKRSVKSAGISGMFWLSLPDDLLSPAQLDHQDCGPFYFGIDLAETSVSFEFLVRGESNLHCSCISYATEPQREFLLGFVDRMVSEEQIQA